MKNIKRRESILSDCPRQTAKTLEEAGCSQHSEGITELPTSTRHNPPMRSEVFATSLDIFSCIHQDTLEDITMLSKTGWKDLVSRKVQNRAFTYLTDLKATHSTARNIQYQKLKLQSYLGSSENNLRPRLKIIRRLKSAG